MITPVLGANLGLNSNVNIINNFIIFIRAQV